MNRLSRYKNTGPTLLSGPLRNFENQLAAFWFPFAPETTISMLLLSFLQNVDPLSDRGVTYNSSMSANITCSACLARMPETVTHLYTGVERGNCVLSSLSKGKNGARFLVWFKPTSLGLGIECRSNNGATVPLIPFILDERYERNREVGVFGRYT